MGLQTVTNLLALNFRRRQDVAGTGRDCGRDDGLEGHEAFDDLATGLGGGGGVGIVAGGDGGGLAVVGGAEERPQLPTGINLTVTHMAKLSC